MPDIVTHYALSLLIANRVARLRYAVLLALVGLLPDIDVLFRVHRWFTHSLLIICLVICIAIALALITSRGLRYIAVASALYILHIAFDLFTAPTPILWPAIDKSYMISIGLDGTIAVDHIAVIPSVSIISEVVDFTPRQIVEGPILTPMSVIIAVVVIAMLIIEHITSAKKV